MKTLPKPTREHIAACAAPAITSHVVGRYYPGDFHKPVAQDCADCGKLTEVLELFPGGRCLECHAAAPERFAPS